MFRVLAFVGPMFSLKYLRLALLILAELAVLAALAFSTYVAVDNDLRTLVWSKWKQDVEYEFPGGSRHIDIDIESIDFD